MKTLPSNEIAADLNTNKTYLQDICNELESDASMYSVHKYMGYVCEQNCWLAARLLFENRCCKNVHKSLGKLQVCAQICSLALRALGLLLADSDPPHSWEGGDFLSHQPDYFYENCCNSETESQKIDPKVGNERPLRGLQMGH